LRGDPTGKSGAEIGNLPPMPSVFPGYPVHWSATPTLGASGRRSTGSWNECGFNLGAEPVSTMQTTAARRLLRWAQTDRSGLTDFDTGRAPANSR